jgi:hypothetical protein
VNKTASINVSSDAVLDAMEEILWTGYGQRADCSREVRKFVEGAQELLAVWQERIDKHDLDVAAEVRRALETAAKAAVDNAPRVGQEAAR